MVDETGELIGRLADRLPVNPPYTGITVEAYDAWLPFDLDAHLEPFESIVGTASGEALELGCGTGRVLLPLLARGHRIAGIDESESMLAACRDTATRYGLPEPDLHVGSFAPLSLGGAFGALICPASTFTLVHDRDVARQALQSWHAHLEPGGAAAFDLHVPTWEFGARLGWRVRRTGTLPDGRTVVVHEAVVCDTSEQLRHALNRIETYDMRGQLTATEVRRQCLRWWTHDQIAAEARSVGFVDVEIQGDTDHFTVVARR